ncbi:flagellin [uncultured Clostridium sp.]|uniref:flagellin N-terminal helical domain-containing protein n=1 Tax=uncultured Clostridium sp. TaxID=59620 RepID=UPI0028E47377|nr:flagellin [uncultured Clostridium sp.]
MVINHNLMASNAIRNANINTNNSAKSMEKLSSGLRINRAGDDAAGLAISEKMRGQIRGLDQAGSNAQDGISMIQTAEGALNETHSILQRMRELAVQSGTDTNTASDRLQIQKEVDQLSNEVSRIGNTTQFNTQKLLDGSFKGATFQIGANSNQAMGIKLSDMRSSALGLTGDVTVNMKDNGTITAGASNALTQIQDGVYTVSKNANGTYDLMDSSGSVVANSTDNGKTYVNSAVNSNTIAFTDTVTSGQITVKNGTGATGDELEAAPAANSLEAGTYTWDSTNKSLVDDSGNVVATSTDGQVFTNGTSTVLTLNTALTAGGQQVVVHGTDLTNRAAANTAITTIQKALDTVSTQRSSLGAYQNRLEHTINNLGTSSENLSAAESRIRDVDMAKEMSTYSKNNILAQAAQAMLAQANQQPQQVLSLLR